MIYLFEDRKERMNQCFKGKMDDTIIKVSVFDCEKDGINLYIKDNYSDAKAILFHSSYTFPKNGYTIENVKAAFIEQKIPFIYFSGGLRNNIINETTANVNSGDMYNNLPEFLDCYKNEKKIVIPLLVYGKRFLINSLLEMQNLITNYFFNKKYNDPIGKNDIDYIVDNIIDISLNLPKLKEDKDDLINWLKSSKNPQISLILSQIQKLIDKYPIL